MEESEVNFMLKNYTLVVRDEISTNKPITDETLKALDCYFESPVFEAEGTEEELNIAIEKYKQNFEHFKNWSAELVSV